MNSIIKRLVVEARFRFILRFRETVPDFFQSRLDAVTRIQLNENESLSLIDDNGTRRFFCERNKAGFLIENDAEQRFFPKQLEQLDALLTHCKISTIERLGVRMWFLSPLSNESSPDAVKAYGENLLALKTSFTNSYPITDFAVILNTKTDEANFRMETGVVRSEEVKERFSEFHWPGDPELSLLHDIDCFATSVPSTSVTRRVQKMMQETTKLLKLHGEGLDGIQFEQ